MRMAFFKKHKLQLELSLPVADLSLLAKNTPAKPLCKVSSVIVTWFLPKVAAIPHQVAKAEGYCFTATITISCCMPTGRKICWMKDIIY